MKGVQMILLRWPHSCESNGLGLFAGRWPLWESASMGASADPGRIWLCGSDWITILRKDNLGIGRHSEASKSGHWTLVC